MIKLEMLSHIAFGQREYVEQLLRGAEDDIAEIKHALVNSRQLNKKDLFSQLHNLKTTLSMLQAGQHVQICQGFLDQINHVKNEGFHNDLDQFLDKLIDVENAITEEINKK